MKYGDNWREDLSKEYDGLCVIYAELKSAYKKGERLCEKPPKPTEPLIFGKDELSEKYISVFREYAKTRDVRKKAFADAKEQ